MLTYNRKQFLDRSIRSILTQDFSDFEFILVNNGSTDGSGEVCETFAHSDPRIKVIHKPFGNIGSGRNAGVKAARCEYVTFVDDDDYAYPDMLSFLYGLAAGNGADISFCGSDKEIDGKVLSNCTFDSLHIFTPQEAVVKLLDRVYLNAATPTKLFRKSIVEMFPFSEENHYEDIFITYKLFASANKVAAHGLPKYCFVRHQTNNSRFTTNDDFLSPLQLDEYFEAYRERTAWLIERFPGIKDVVVYSEWSFLISMYNKIVSNHIANCDKQQQYIRGILNEHRDEFGASVYCKPFEHEYLRRYFL
jgi:glycosyltransferase involved in cell wall biosynthesis